VENTLYRLSIYALAQGSEFFASTFSLKAGESIEGVSDEQPVVLPPTITCAEFDVYLRFGVESVIRVVISGLTSDMLLVRYDQNPTQDHLINAISIARKWSINALYGYASDHFRRQFLTRQIHPAVVLGVARRFGIAGLVEPAVKMLSRADMPLSLWSTDASIICHMTALELGVIGRMREKMLLARFALCDVPPVLHDRACRDKLRMTCSSSWKEFWRNLIVPRLINMDGDVENMVWRIRTDCVANANVQGMVVKCREVTINEVLTNGGWMSDVTIVEGAVHLLAVEEGSML
jgi:hypothetical protein